MADFLRGFAETFNPAFQRMYQQGFLSAEQDAERQAKLAQQAQQQGNLLRLLKGGLSPEEEAMTYAGAGNEGQQAYNLYQKLREPKPTQKFVGEVKYDNGVPKRFNEISQQYETVQGLGQQEKKVIYDPDLPYIAEVDERGFRTPLMDKTGKPMQNPEYKPKTSFRPTGKKKPDYKTGRWEIEIGEYLPNSDTPIATKVEFAPIKEKTEHGDRLTKETFNEFNSELKNINDLAEQLKYKTTGVYRGGDEPVIPTLSGDVSIPQYKERIRNEIYSKTTELENRAISLLSPSAKQVYDNIINQEIVVNGKTLKKKGQYPTPEAFKIYAASLHKKIDLADTQLLGILTKLNRRDIE